MAIMTTMQPMMSQPSKVMALAVTTSRWTVRFSPPPEELSSSWKERKGDVGSLACGLRVDPRGGAGGVGKPYLV